MFYYFLPADTPENWEKASTETIAYLFLQDCLVRAHKYNQTDSSVEQEVRRFLRSPWAKMHPVSRTCLCQEQNWVQLKFSLRHLTAA